MVGKVNSEFKTGIFAVGGRIVEPACGLTKQWFTTLLPGFSGCLLGSPARKCAGGW